ncbi:MAG: hypothetical protein QNK37_11580 [Acidobacteriota bacterium]|nr:hypothetical protein [Acidobacteriota bacterium]
MKAMIMKLSAHRRWPLLMGLSALVLTLPALLGDWSSDDYIVRAVLEGKHPHPAMDRPIQDMFRMMPGPEFDHTVFRERGLLPWWAHPEIRLSFSRPIPALTLALDHLLWAENAMMWHLHNLLWFAVGVWIIGLVFREIHGAGTGVAGLAALLFALEDARAGSAAWISDRSGAMVIIPAGLALIHYIRLRRDGNTRSGIIALGCYLLALLTKEAAVGALAFLFAWEFWLGKGTLKTRLAALAPYIAVTVVWRLVYNSMGYGASGSGIYVDPINDPWGFLQSVFVNGPLLMFAQWFQGPIDFWLAFPPQTQRMILTAMLILCGLLCVFFFKLLRTQAEARFYATAMVLAAIPLCSAVPMERVLTFVSPAAFGLLALEVERIGWLEAKAAVGNLFTRWITGLLLAIHLFGAVLLPLRAMTYPMLHSIFEAAPDAMTGLPGLDRKTLVFVNGDDLSFHIPFILLDRNEPVPAKQAVLGLASADLEVTRVDEHTLRIHDARGWLYRTAHRLYNDLTKSFAVGEEIRGSAFTARIEELTGDGRPMTVSFRFDKPLEDAEYLWYCWRNGAMVPFQLPPVGGKDVLPLTIPGWTPPSD